jgi:DNA-binding MarR family transcriptional regulator
MVRPRAWVLARRLAPLAGVLALACLGAWAPWAAAPLALFSRLEPVHVALHPTRRAILEAAAVDPGVTMRALQARLGIAWGTLVHHVRVLERHGQLVSVREGQRRHLYVARSPEARQRSGLAVLRSPAAHRVARAVHERPGLLQVDLCRRIGLRAPAASKQLARLERAGLVEVERAGGACRYAPSPGLAAALGLRRQPGHDGAGASRPPRPPRQPDAPACRHTERPDAPVPF